MNEAQRNLERLGLTLPSQIAAVASYVPFVLHGGVVYVSGQIPRVGDVVRFVGKLGLDLGVSEGEEAARICALRVLAVAQQAAGDLDRVKQILELTVYVNSSVDFVQHSVVADAASDVIEQVLGARGRHSRVAVGVAQLPKGAAVEVSARLALS